MSQQVMGGIYCASYCYVRIGFDLHLFCCSLSLSIRSMCYLSSSLPPFLFFFIIIYCIYKYVRIDFEADKHKVSPVRWGCIFVPIRSY